MAGVIGRAAGKVITCSSPEEKEAENESRREEEEAKYWARRAQRSRRAVP